MMKLVFLDEVKDYFKDILIFKQGINSSLCIITKKKLKYRPINK